jgi:cell division protein FtsI (penicillin-binding protein 3)
MTESGKRPYPGRLALIVGFVTIWSFLIICRLVQLQVFRRAEYARLAVKGQVVTREIAAPRGILYDSHMDELATSIPVSAVVAEPRRIKDIPAAAEALSAILGIDRLELLDRLKDPAKQVFQYVKHRIDPKAELRVESLGVQGIYLEDENMRVYPNLELACHVIGFVNMNGDGGAGLEQRYDRELKGTPGQISFDVDGKGSSFRGTVEKPPRMGHSLVLSIDRSIQYTAARELSAGVEKSRAAAGVAIVMESDTGRILALASYPYFNCNKFNEYAPDYWRNRAVSDLYEPGSTFKVVVAAAALEAGLTHPNELIDCQMGSITIGRHVFHDHKPYGLLTFSQILENSSNVGAAKLGLRLGEQRLYDALLTFGFGARTAIDLPAELPGLVRDWRHWSALSIGAISFGQEVGVTSVQILSAVNAIANGGYRVRPSVVDRVIDQDGNLVRVRPSERSRIMRDETAASIREAFEGVVLRGTGKRAALEGYRAAGKTGTAQKIVDGRYSNTKYLASFIGFAPLPDPRLTILVWIDEPKGQIYGGDAAAPVFQRIMQESLLQLHVRPDQSIPLPKLRPEQLAGASEDYLPNATPIVPVADLRRAGEPASEDEGVIAVWVGSETVAVPDFHGMPKRRVLVRCQELGIHMQSSGSGLAVFQLPSAGTRISVGDVCQVTFANTIARGVARTTGVVDNGIVAQHVIPDSRASGARP